MVKGNWRLKKGGKRGKGKGKAGEESPAKSPPVVNDTTLAPPIPTQFTSPNKSPEKTASSATDINWSHYAPFFRELDISAFKILSYDTVKIGSKVYFNSYWYRIKMILSFKLVFPSHSVVKFQSWALFTNFKCKKGNEGGRDWT